MEFLHLMKKETGKEKLSLPELYAKIVTPGTFFSYVDREYYSLGQDKNSTLFYCKKRATTLEVESITKDDFLFALENKKIKLLQDPDELVIDEDLLSPKELDRYKRLKSAMNHIVENYGPDYHFITSKEKKDELKELSAQTHLSYPRFRRKINQFLTSGMKNHVLLSRRSDVFGDKRKRNSHYQYTVKTGRKPRAADGSVINQGVPITEDIKRDFEPYLKLLDKKYTITQIYDRYVVDHGLQDSSLLEEGDSSLLHKDIPTLCQFRFFIQSRLTKEERIRRRKGDTDYRNNHRALTSDVLSTTTYPGEVVEIDAWEADVSLIRRGTTDQVVGRPTLYLMIDRYTRLIVAYSVGFEVNSYIGLSSLFMNLVEDKVGLFRKTDYF